eukprot:964066-Pyramimonas_sp.AAC.1
MATTSRRWSDTAAGRQTSSCLSTWARSKWKKRGKLSNIFEYSELQEPTEYHQSYGKHYWKALAL